MKTLIISIILAGCYMTSLKSRVVDDVTVHDYSTVRNFQDIPWERMLDPNARFILSSEVHEVSCNYDLLYSLVSRYQRKGFTNLILEMPYSYGLLSNHYLETGDDSVLNLISRTEEARTFWKNIRSLNTIYPESKIKAWGVDFELDGGKRKELFLSAIKLLVDQGVGIIPPALQNVIGSVQGESNSQSVGALKDALEQIVNDSVLVNFFGTSYADFKILVTREDRFTVRRDKLIFENFIEIHHNFFRNRSPRFIAQFGWGHTRKSNRDNFGGILQSSNSSPVKDRVQIVGTQYINCYSNLPGDSTYLNPNAGVIRSDNLKRTLKRITENDTSKIKLFQPSPKNLKAGLFANSDVFILLSGFAASTTLKVTKL